MKKEAFRGKATERKSAMSFTKTPLFSPHLGLWPWQAAVMQTTLFFRAPPRGSWREFNFPSGSPWVEIDPAT